MSALQYRIQGSGPDLLLIHGWAMHSGVWADFAPLLTQRFRTIMVDLRGHGGSRGTAGPYGYSDCARDVIELVHGLGIVKTAALGWSMGASILLKAQALAPEIFKPLVFIGANPSLVSRPDYACGIPAITVKRLYRQVERAYPEGLHNFYNLLLTEQEKKDFGADPVYATITDSKNAPDKDAALGLLDCLIHEDLRSGLASVQSPALILHGAQDGICHPGAAAFMHARLPGSRLVVFEQTGHLPFLTRRNECAAYLLDFLEQTR